MTTDYLVSIADAQAKLSLGKTFLYQLLAKDTIPAVKIGKRTCIRNSDLDKFIESLEAFKSRNGGDYGRN